MPHLRGIGHRPDDDLAHPVAQELFDGGEITLDIRESGLVLLADAGLLGDQRRAGSFQLGDQRRRHHHAAALLACDAP
jgi:hypothetical protein